MVDRVKGLPVDNVMDRWLGKTVITGDGRTWTVIKFSGPKGGDTVTLTYDYARLQLPVYVFVAAMEYGLLEEV